MVSVNNAYRTIAQLYGCLLHIAGHFCKFECFAVALCLGMLHTPLSSTLHPASPKSRRIGGTIFNRHYCNLLFETGTDLQKKSGIEKAQML